MPIRLPLSICNNWSRERKRANQTNWSPSLLLSISFCNPTSLQMDQETVDLQFLLDAFAPKCSLEEIASAYCKANGDVNSAGEILFDLQTSNSGSQVDDSSNGSVSSGPLVDSLEDDDNMHALAKNSKVSKHKKSVSSTGTISSVLGKGLIRRCQPQKGSADKSSAVEVTQPEVLIDSEMSHCTNEVTPLRNGDVEEFLFSMLQDGFNLDKEKIQEVFRSCGCDGKKCMEELLDVSAMDFVKNKDKPQTQRDTFADKCSRAIPHFPEENSPLCKASHREPGKSTRFREEGSLTAKEVLEALFTASELPEEPPNRTNLNCKVNKTRTSRRRVISVPLDDVDSAKPTHFSKSLISKRADNFEVLRRSAKQHWESMKAYYEAAFDAFTQGNRDKANNLLEQGKYHNKMAREADEKSAGETVTRGTDDDLVLFTLDLHLHEASVAVSLLKTHLGPIARNYRYLRVIVDCDAEDTTKGKRKCSVIRFLKRKQLPWTEEEGNPGIFLIQMDLIDPDTFC